MPEAPRNMKPGSHRPKKRPPESRCGADYPRRLSPHKRGYDNNWRKFRDWYLSRNPVCTIREKCQGAAASEVDHIKPIRQGGARLDTSNVQAACKPCHSWKTATQDRKYTNG